ncbi:MAG: DUF4956 domain-containing protein [Gemmatimonadota bacterium]
MTDQPNGLPNTTDRRQAPDTRAAAEVRTKNKAGPPRGHAIVRLALFYLLIIAAGIALITYVPIIRNAWVSATANETSQLSDITKTDALTLTAKGDDPAERAISVLFITLGALLISLPVAWVYTLTRRLRYDPSLVHSVIMLPMVVSAIVVIVKDSVALAFSLAGIVAVVRFRNTLKDPKDAVYIFLALGIGLASGIQALDIALVMSLMFNTVILVLWRYNLGEIYGETHRDLFAIGNRGLMIARNAAQRDSIRWRMSREARDMQTDGILLVHTDDPEAAKQRVEMTLAPVADEFRITDNFRTRNGTSTFAVMMRLKDKKGDPLAVLAELDERWSQEIMAAEYIPFKKAAEKDET